MSSKKTPVKVFISYATADEGHKKELDKHLHDLKRQGLIESFDASQIKPGEQWANKLNLQLEAADIVLLLMSADALADDYIHEQAQKAIARAESKAAVFIPILLRPVNYSELGIGHFAALPSNGKAVNEWDDKDKAYRHIANKLQEVAENIGKPKTGSPQNIRQILADDGNEPTPEGDKIKHSKNVFRGNVDTGGGDFRIGDDIHPK